MEALTPCTFSPVAGSPHFTSPDLLYHSVSNHPSDSCYRFLTLPLSVTGYFRASPFGSRLASHFRPYRVCYPTDWYIVFRCSPPCVATAQLLRLTGRRERARRELSSLMPGLLMGALPRPTRPQMLNYLCSSVFICGFKIKMYKLQRRPEALQIAKASLHA